MWWGMFQNAPSARPGGPVSGVPTPVRPWDFHFPPAPPESQNKAKNASYGLCTHTNPNNTSILRAIRRISGASCAPGAPAGCAAPLEALLPLHAPRTCAPPGEGRHARPRKPPHHNHSPCTCDLASTLPGAQGREQVSASPNATHESVSDCVQACRSSPERRTMKNGLLPH